MQMNSGGGHHSFLADSFLNGRIPQCVPERYRTKGGGVSHYIRSCVQTKPKVEKKRVTLEIRIRHNLSLNFFPVLLLTSRFFLPKFLFNKFFHLLRRGQMNCLYSSSHVISSLKRLKENLTRARRKPPSLSKLLYASAFSVTKKSKPPGTNSIFQEVQLKTPHLPGEENSKELQIKFRKL